MLNIWILLVTVAEKRVPNQFIQKSSRTDFHLTLTLNLTRTMTMVMSKMCLLK